MISEVFLFTLGMLFDDNVKTIPVARSSLPNLGPKPLVHPFGPGYSMHPELSRSGLAVIASRAFLPVAVISAGAFASYSEAKAFETISSNESLPTEYKIRFGQGLIP